MKVRDELKTSVSIVCPVFNEEEGISFFLSECNTVLNEITSMFPSIDFEFVLVDDGSTDGTCTTIESVTLNWPIHFIRFSRNFGHQSAVWAGLEMANEKNYVIVMDSDMQDDPKNLVAIVKQFFNGAEIVLMQRVSREDSLGKKFFAHFFYKVQQRLAGGKTIPNVGDFFGMSPQVRTALLQHKEQVKYIRGLIPSLGFRQVLLPYDRAARKHGSTHYTLSKMVGLAISGITGFSIKPLLWILYSAFLGAFVAVFFAFYVFWIKFFSHLETAPGWAFLSISSLFLAALQLISLAVMSIYISRIMEEVKARPPYIISTEVTINSGEQTK